MLIDFLGNPIFWVGIYLVGYTIAIVVISIPVMQTKVENKIPKPLVRIFIFLTFIVPPVVLPFTEGPKIVIATPVALSVGIIIIGINFIIKIMAQRQIGVLPALKCKERLIRTGIYGIVRHPLYISNVLLALGMAVLFKSMYAILFSIPYFFLYLPITHFEERGLLEKYGRDYEEYKRRVPRMMIPKIF